MRLSKAYVAKHLYAVVYHIADNSDEVELVANRFFKTEQKAWWWFNKNFHDDDFNQVEVVQVTNFDTLTFENPELSY